MNEDELFTPNLELEPEKSKNNSLKDDIVSYYKLLYALERLNDHYRILSNKVAAIDTLLDAKHGMGDRLFSLENYIEDVKAEVVKQDAAKVKLIEERGKFKWLILGGVVSVIVTLAANFFTASKVDRIDQQGTDYFREKIETLEQIAQENRKRIEDQERKDKILKGK